MNAPTPVRTQEIPLLATKLYIPPPRTNLVSRPHLIARLDEGVCQGRRLTLISAPAGYGKTTLLSEWAASAPTNRRFVWLSLDEADNAPARFFTYLLAALEQVDPQIGHALQTALGQPRPPALPTADGASPAEPHWALTATTWLINDLFRSSAASPLVLVLDDYHAIVDALIHEAVDLLLDRQPPHLHLVIATRQDPPLSLSRLRARGQMTEIRQQDLRFTAQEAARFVAQAAGRELTASDVAALEERTEGWAAGLQLAALSMQGRDERDTARFLRVFSGRNAFVLDYLTDEVLQRQPGPIQRFLLHTSILERLCGPLCDALLQEDKGPQSEDLTDSQAVLERLDRANLFVVPLDDERRWYRYHRLFGDLLRARLSEMAADRESTSILELHRRAATWYDENGLPADAVHHALLAQDDDRAADIVERAIQRVSAWTQIHVGTFMDWFDALPNDVVRTRPRLQLFASRVHYLTGQPAETERLLQQITAYLADHPDTSDARQILDLVAADRASYAAVRGDVREAIVLAQGKLAQLAPDDTLMRMRLSSTLGLAHERAGDLDLAEQAFSEAIASASALGMDFAAVPLVCNLAEIQFSRGRLAQAAELCARATEMGTVDGVPHSVTGYAGIELAKILYEQNDLQRAARHVVEGIERLAQGGSPDSFGHAHAVLARIKQAQGDAQGALAAVDYAVRMAQDSQIFRAIHLASAHGARIWLAQGKLAQAARWADEYRQVGKTEYLREIEDLSLARILLTQDEATEALVLLDRLLAAAEAAGRLGTVIEAQALRALALEALGDRNQALETLARALSLAAPAGYARVFLGLDRPMGELLLAISHTPALTSKRAAASAPFDAGYVHKLLAACAQETTSVSGSAAIVDRQPLIEPLTDRELEVLYLLAEGLTNPEIGQRLYISRPTVKTHTRNIYAKLDVHSRREAVAQARVLGILPPL